MYDTDEVTQASKIFSLTFKTSNQEFGNQKFDYRIFLSEIDLLDFAESQSISIHAID